MTSFVERCRHAILGVCAIVMAQSAFGVTLGQVDDFEDGTVQGWSEGGSPNPPVNAVGGPPGSSFYLSNVSSGAGTAGGKMTFFNEAQWTGDFISVGITEVRAWVRVDPASDGPLNLRVGFRAASEFGMQGHVSLNAIVVPDDGIWREVVFPIGPTDLVPTGFTFLNYAQTMSDVGHMRFLNSTNVDWQGQNFAATLGIDNITAGPVDAGTNYQGWLWETSTYTDGFSVDEENCFGPVNLTVNEDMTWAYTGTDQVCRGRQTTPNSRTFINPAPFVTDEFAVDGSIPLESAGGNLYEVFGEVEEENGVERLATALFEPSGEDVVILGSYETTDLPGDREGLGFVHLLAKSTASIADARTAEDLEGTSWRVAMMVHTVSQTGVNAEIANSGILTLDLQGAGACEYVPTSVFPDFITNRDLYSALQFSNGTNLDNRGLQAGINSAEITNCSYEVDADGYLAISATLTFDSNPGNPQPLALRFVVSDDDQFLVHAPATSGVDDNPQVLLVGFRAANALPVDAIDGEYLFYLTLAEFEATGSLHSEGRAGRQEYDFRGRGVLSFDSTTLGSIPAGETGTWYDCSARLVMDGVELGYMGDYGSGTATPDSEISAEYLVMSSCDYRLDADGALLVHLTDTVADEPDPVEVTLRGYVNSNGEMLSLSQGTTDPAPPTDPATEDAASVYFVLGMKYIGDLHGDEDGDTNTNVQEFQIPLAPIPSQSVLLRRSTDSRWFKYSLFGADVVEKGRPDMTRSSDYTVVSRADFNGDGEPDALLRDLVGGENGRWVLYTLVGTTTTSQGFADLTRNADWQLIATEDYDGDGDADVLVRNVIDGRWLLYLMDAQDVEAQGVIAMSMDLGDQFAGTGDFNGDGRHDVLLRRPNGSWQIYFLNGLTAPVLGLPALTTNLNFLLIAIADFNGDGRSDILLRRTDGRWFMYVMNGAAVETSGSLVITENNAFSYQSSADFDGDGNADVLLRRDDGRWFMYTLDGIDVVTQGSPDMTRNLDFGIVSTVDFTDDGRADILMRRADGRWVLYEMSGTAVLSTGIPDMTRNPEWIPYGP